VKKLTSQGEKRLPLSEKDKWHLCIDPPVLNCSSTLRNEFDSGEGSMNIDSADARYSNDMQDCYWSKPQPVTEMRFAKQHPSPGALRTMTLPQASSAESARQQVRRRYSCQFHGERLDAAPRARVARMQIPAGD
jgi:hypothetical protein